MAEHPDARALEFLRTDPLGTTRVVPDAPVPAGPFVGSALFRIERFALTANNVTYAVNGDVLGYWKAFPTTTPGWGRVPAWGVARVVDGDPGLVRPGRLFAGYQPMATHVVVRAEALPDGTLRATDPTRAEMYPLYRDLHPVDDAIGDAEIAVLPSVPTAAHLDDELRAQDPAQVVFSSGSSRTAMTTALLLRRSGVRVVGLTAPERVGAARRADVYDLVLPYDEITAVPASPGTAYVDVAGAPEITAAVHEHLGRALHRSVRVGGSHTRYPAGGAGSGTLPGPAVERFNVGQRRVEVAERIGELRMSAWERDVHGPLSAWAAEHLTVERVRGLEEARRAWRRVWQGELDPLSAVTVLPD